MARAEELECEFCGCFFSPCHYNGHHQICCGSPPCRRAAAALRQRLRRARILSDPARAGPYREEEAKRQRERRASKSVGRPSSGLGWLASSDGSTATIIGLVAQMGDSHSLEDVRGVLNELAARGRRLVRAP